MSILVRILLAGRRETSDKCPLRAVGRWLLIPYYINAWLVGADGLVLQNATHRFSLQEAATILLVILARVIIGEFIPAWLRRQILF